MEKHSLLGVDAKRIAYVSTYPPKECGIANFSKDLIDAICPLREFGPPMVVAINEENAIYNYDKRVKFQIERSSTDDYIKAAHYINPSKVRLVNIQHEFGLFGGKWDCWKVGAAGPLIKVKEGLLFIYHGVNFEKVYRLGAILLDKDDPERVLYRSESPILEPVLDYECFGRVPNVVFSCGAVLIDDKLFMYYGGADTAICVATYDIDELMSVLENVDKDCSQACPTKNILNRA